MSTPTAAPFEKQAVREIFHSLMKIAKEQHNIAPIENLKDPVRIDKYVLSFDSSALFHENLEEAFLQNGYSYTETLKQVADTGLTVLTDYDGGAGMSILLAMPAKGIKTKDWTTLFQEDDLKNFQVLMEMYDNYLCCPLLEDF